MVQYINAHALGAMYAIKKKDVSQTKDIPREKHTEGWEADYTVFDSITVNSGPYSTPEGAQTKINNILRSLTPAAGWTVTQPLHEVSSTGYRYQYMNWGYEGKTYYKYHQMFHIVKRGNNWYLDHYSYDKVKRKCAVCGTNY